MSVPTPAGTALKFVITVIGISTNGPSMCSSMAKILVAFPARSLLKASADKALIYEVSDNGARQLDRSDYISEI